MSRTVVVTDSTASLAPEVAAEWGIVVVPLQLIVGDRTVDEDPQASADTVTVALRRRQPVSTSRPNPEVMLAAYERAAADGATELVSVHLSSKLSGTFESAEIAARRSPVPVRTVDTGQLGMGTGFAVLAAARAVSASGDAVAAEASARSCADATRSLFYVDTLEHLRRGGRIGAAAALLGTALAVKPLLHVVDGRIAPLEKVRTVAKAVARLEDLAIQRAGPGPVDVAVHHLEAKDRAELLGERLCARLPAVVDLHVSEVGAVVGAHVGPGLLGVVVSRR